MSAHNDRFQRKMAETFSPEELQGLCFSLSIPYDELEGNTKSARIRSLLQYAERHNLTNTLIAKLKEERPAVNWDGTSYGDVDCPYRGLLAFREKDAAFFFGRDQAASNFVQMVKAQPLVAIIGPSGSGKSSVLFAGGLPRLRRHGNWVVVPFRPGHEPFLSLAKELVPLLLPHTTDIETPFEVRNLARYLRDNKIPISDYLEMIRKKQSVESQILLVVDQFEELFTQCSDISLRHQFLRKLIDCIQNDKLTTKIVLTMRADFMEQALDIISIK